MSKSTIHLALYGMNQEGPVYACRYSLYVGSRATDDRDGVTCKLCRKIIGSGYS